MASIIVEILVRFKEYFRADHDEAPYAFDWQDQHGFRRVTSVSGAMTGLGASITAPAGEWTKLGGPRRFCGPC